jgi:hypothetical protein
MCNAGFLRMADYPEGCGHVAFLGWDRCPIAANRPDMLPCAPGNNMMNNPWIMVMTNVPGLCPTCEGMTPPGSP